MQRNIATILIVLAALTSARAQDGPSPANTGPSLNGLHWLAGSWRGTGLGGEIEEHWLTASSGTMLGIFRLVRENAKQVIEYVMVSEEPDRVVMRFKHFNTDYTTWENDLPLEFTLVSLSDHEAVFHSEVPGQHSPRRIIYRLTDGGGSLSVVVAGSDEDGRLTESFDLHFSRQ